MQRRNNMAEKIIINIDVNGNVSLETENMYGPACIDEVKKILKNVDYNEKDIEKKDDFYKSNIVVENHISIKRG